MRQPFVIPSVFLALIGIFCCFLYSTQLSHWVLRFTLVPEQVYLSEFPGGDFRLFWAQGSLAHQGKPMGAYDAASILAAAHTEKLPGVSDVRPSFYPPNFIYMMQPLGSLPYPQAWHIYNWGSVLLMALVTILAFRRQYYSLPLLLGFGGLWCALAFGQNSILLTALYLALAAWGARYEAVGGLLLAIASFKPHLGVLAPLMLFWRAQNKTILWAGLGIAALVGITSSYYGTQIWLRYIEVLHEPINRLIDFNRVQAQHMISLYAGLRSYNIEPVYALAAQGVLALIAIQMLWRICRRALDPMLPVAALVTATLLAMPHTYSYDLMLLFIPLMLLVKRAQVFGWTWADGIVVLLVYLMPYAVDLLNVRGLPLSPLVLLFLLYRLKQHSRMDHV